MGSGSWPSPFWAGELDEWHHPPKLEWHDEASGQEILFQATFVEPEHWKQVNSGWWPGKDRQRISEVPIVFFFGGIDCGDGADGFTIRQFAKSISKTCVLVLPFRPKGTWWVLNKAGTFGHIDGDLCEDLLQAYMDWMRCLCKAARDEGIDSRPRVMGFSAGAYALTELLLHSARPFIWCMALCALHGHGQPETDELADRRRKTASDKFAAYLSRLRKHPGIPGGLYCFHHPEDKVCPWPAARQVAEVLGTQQRRLKYDCKVTEIWELDKTSRKTTARQIEQGVVPLMHGYQNTALLSNPFVDEFLEGPTPNGGPRSPSRTSSRPQRTDGRWQRRRSRSPREEGGASPPARSRTRWDGRRGGRCSRSRSPCHRVGGASRRRSRSHSPYRGDAGSRSPRRPVRLVARACLVARA